MASPIVQNANSDEICHDEKIHHLKEVQMAKMKTGATLGSISRMATFAAGILAAASLGILGPAIAGAGASMSAIGAAITASPVGLTFLVAAAVTTAAAIGADYVATRIWQSTTLDNTELNAQRVADNLVSKMKENNMCVTQTHEQNCRADGRKWVEVTRPNMAPQPQHLS